MAEFDPIALEYDRTFTDTATGWAQRKRVWAYLEKLYANGDVGRVLEINCGTGEDACFLAGLGCSVCATDASQAMIAETAQKAAARGLLLRTARIDLATPPESMPEGGPFDLVFSNFGGLNCLSPQQLAGLSPHLARWLRPGGHFVAVFMPKGCFWETLYFLAKLKPKQAFRRWNGGPVRAPLGGENFVDTWYFSPDQFAAACAPDFRERHRRGIGIALPPSYLEPFFQRNVKIWPKLDAWEKRLSKSAYFARNADHCLMHFTLKVQDQA